MRLVVPFLAAFVMSHGLCGCAHSAETQADRQFAEMRAQVDDMTADHDKQLGHLDDGEDPQLRAQPPASAGSSGAKKPPSPALQRSVQLGEGDNTGESDDPNDPTQRPEIKVTGSGGGSFAPSPSVSNPSTQTQKRSRRKNTDDAKEPR